MVIDSSAVIAIIAEEPDYEQLEACIAEDSFRIMSVASILECTIVLRRRGAHPTEWNLDRRLRQLQVYPIEVSHAQLAAARAAYLQYGRGVHPAGLNFGDCFSYALAKISREPLLYKGSDFSRTDIPPALRP